MTATSHNEAALELRVTVHPSRRAGQVRARQGSEGLEGIRTMRDETTSGPRRRRFAHRIGRGCTRDVVIASMKQVTLLACAPTLCGAEKPDEFTVPVGC